MILVCGEALIDLFVDPTRRTGRGGVPGECVPGGSPFNVAIGLARLGRRVGFLAKLSDDGFGALLRARLVAEGVAADWLATSPRPTTLSVVMTGADGQPAYSFLGEGAADRALEMDDLPVALPDAVGAIAIGSYALAVEPVGTAIAALVARERGRRVISVDPNIRPRVIGDVAAWRPRFEALLAGCDIAKASIEDMQLLYGPQVGVEEVARRWLALGPRLVAVTLGAEGAMAFTAASQCHVPGRAVIVADTVGAGDTFHAALLGWLDERGLLTKAGLAATGLASAELAAAVGFAVAASAVTCTRRGADLPRRNEVPA